jgi:hypothetical protein
LIKAWIPFSELIPQLYVEYPGANLQQQVGALLTPAHLLLLDHPFTHGLVDGRFGESSVDGLCMPITLGVIWDESCVAADIGLELLQLLDPFFVLLRGILNKDILRENDR